MTSRRQPIPLQNSSAIAYMQVQGSEVDVSENAGPGGRPIAIIGAGYNNDEGLDIDWENADMHERDLEDGANVITLSNIKKGSISIILNGLATSTVTWPAAVQWPGGTEPTQTEDGTDVYTLMSPDGVRVYGTQLADFS